MWIDDPLDIPPLLHYRVCLDQEQRVFEDRWCNVETGTVWRRRPGTNMLEGVLDPALRSRDRGKLRETVIRGRWGEMAKGLPIDVLNEEQGL
jgi:hypothetical protein